MSPRVCIVIVNYNNSEDTIECVRSLEKISYDNIIIIIVDNGSKPENSKKLHSISDNPKVRLVFSKENLGFAGGNNLGIVKHCDIDSDFIMLLNDDTTVDADFIENMLNSFKHNENIGVVSPMILSYNDRNNIQNAGGYINFFRGTTQSAVKNLNKNKGKYTTFATGCCMLIKPGVIKKIGLMKTDYFLYYEDTDFSVRVLDGGYNIWFEPSAKIYHKGGTTSVRGSDNYQYYYLRNRLMFIKRNFKLKHKLTSYICTFAFILKSLITHKSKFKNVRDAVNDFITNKMGKRGLL